MDARVKPAPHEIRLARAGNPKMRERDLAGQLGVSKAELVAAHCGDGADGRMIIQFFGKRHEGERERDDWRLLAENLPRIPRSTAA
jgi:putative heme degradation protein